MRITIALVMTTITLACSVTQKTDISALDTATEQTDTSIEEDTTIEEDTAIEEPANSEDSGIVDDTGMTEDTADTTTEDTSIDTSDTNDVDMYGCQVASLGICMEGFVFEGWYLETASQACLDFGVENNVATQLIIEGCPMTPETVVGACVTSELFPDFTITEWYYTSHWTEEEAQAHCTEQNGIFVT